MLNSALDLPRLKAQFLQTQSLHLADFLRAEKALELRDYLLSGVDWSLAFRTNGRSAALDAAVYAKLSVADLEARANKACSDAKSDGFQFLYDSYQMVSAYLDEPDAEFPLHRVLRWLNCDEFLNFARGLTGLQKIAGVNAQATRYRPRHFLRSHNDFDASEGRLCAYVLNLSQNWQADFGGLLHMCDAAGNVTNTLMPTFNSLNVFAVPQNHFVSMVTPYATGERLAITGWFLDRCPI
jgi:SM-20-related protein